MMPLIKICGLSDVAAVDAAVHAGADAVGFVFADSVRRVSVQHAVEISTRVPSGGVRPKSTRARTRPVATASRREVWKEQQESRLRGTG